MTPTPTPTTPPTPTPTTIPTPTPTPPPFSSRCPVELTGWATVNGGAIGGGNATPQRVTSMSELRFLAGDCTPRVLELSGTFTTGSSALAINSNKTLAGLGKDTTIRGGITISGKSNIIVRNLSIIGGGSTHADTDTGKNNHTIHHNWFADLVAQRMQRLLFGKGHIYNYYYNSPGNDYCIGSGSYASLLVENNYFKDVNDPHRFQDSNPSTITANSNIYDNVSGKRDTGSNKCGAPAAWTNPPYNYA